MASELEPQTPFFKTMHISLGVSPKMKNSRNEQTSLLVAARARILKSSEISIALARILSYFVGQVAFSESVVFQSQKVNRENTPLHTREIEVLLKSMLISRARRTSVLANFSFDYKRNRKSMLFGSLVGPGFDLGLCLAGVGGEGGNAILEFVCKND